MHGREGENRKRNRHMWSVPSTETRTVTGNSTADSFRKDGRKISVGDTALFKPPKDSPPFIGIIRWLTLNKESNLQLGVNWLYRPVEVKLGKDILLDVAPNEVFYSFHKDEIPAASLLHPCKVAFLPKGAKLPSGISSFVCRRVYDIANKCLWWLTDQDYINERQEEVDKLLYKTRIEMHATVQPGGRSPKQVNGPTSTSQLKPGSDNVTGPTSSASHVKGKKRERADQVSEPVKRERSSRTDEGDSGQFKPDGSLKSKIAKITDRGGLVDSEGVEKLVKLMQPDRAERKMEVISRSMLAGVIAATDKFDCLSRFVQLRGLTILDEWLQDIHKGKIGDGDRAQEELLLVLLRALDKLPVNLHALQMCNIGKSVNYLRTHKNLEIQKKARSLVDTWKKRVEAEMNVIDGKSGSTQAVSWPSRSRLPGGSSEVPIKSSVTQLSASKTCSVKPVQGESTAKSTSSSPRLMKSPLSPVSSKDGQSRYVAGNTSDIPSTTAREEKSSGSSQSHNNSQSCSSDHGKTMVSSGKEDARSSTAGSMNVNKFSGSGSRHRRSNNGSSGSGGSGAQKETGPNRTSSLPRNLVSDKVSQSGLSFEKSVDMPIVEGISHKLIVKIPNRGRSPAQSASGGSFEDPLSIMNSRASSPLVSEKPDHSDRNSKEKSDAFRANVISDVNTESWQSNDFKDVLTGSDAGDGSPAIPDEERSGTGYDARKFADVSKAGSSSSGNELKSGKLHEASFSSMNALIESCVKYSEGNASMSVGDDMGMNLLASVAAGEMSKSDLGSPIDSPQRNSAIGEDSCTGHDVKSKSSHVDDLAQDESEFIDGEDGEKQAFIAGTLCSRNGLHRPSKRALSNMKLQPTADQCLETNEKMDEVKGSISVSASPARTTEKVMDVDGSKQLLEREAVVTSGSAADSPDTIRKESSSLSINDKANDTLQSAEVGALAVEGSSLEIESQIRKNVNEDFDRGVHMEQKLPLTMMHSETVEITSESIHDSKVGETDEMDNGSRVNQNEQQKNDHEAGDDPAIENQVKACLGTAMTIQKNEFVEPIAESKEDLETHSDVIVYHKESPAFSLQEKEEHKRPKASKLTAAEADETVKGALTETDSSPSPAAMASDMVAKPKFDLNEGFTVDDGKGGEPTVHLTNPPSFPGSSVSSGLPASVTVAAAAKGPFVPPEDLLRSKGEIGWKGSAATSAFRPTEPRKVLEMSLGTTSKRVRPPLDIDLNVPDERLLEEMTSQNSDQEMGSTLDHNNRDMPRSDLIGSQPIRGSGFLDLDLNRIDNDAGHRSTSIGRRMEAQLLPVKSSSSGGFPNFEVRRRDFDLNNGPSLDEVSAEPSSSSFNQHGRSSMQSQPIVSGLRMNNAEMGNFSSWFQPANYLPDRGDQPFPIVAPGGPQRILGSSHFAPDLYRGSVLSSSPAVPFPSPPFQCPVFPFGNSFPLSSATFSGGSATYVDSSSGGRICFPAGNSQLVGPTGAVSSQYPKPYSVNLQDSGNSVRVENRKWGKQGLDLNVGPGGADVEGRDETLPSVSRQLSVVSSQALAEEQARMYNAAGGIMKRKEPEGGWDSESFRSRHFSWH